MLGHLIGVALIPAVLIYLARATRPGRVVFDAIRQAKGRRRAREYEAWHRDLTVRHQRWLDDMAWWGWWRSRHFPGTPEFELAETIIGNLEQRRPPCPHDGFTCPVPHCVNHPRSNQP